VESDYKLETEYLLDCAIPNKPPGDIIFLQECLANYFTNIVQVRRRMEQNPQPNYWTKPTSYGMSSMDPPPPYVADGNGFYGNEKGATKAPATQERNVAAWQVIPLVCLLSSSSNYFHIILLHPEIRTWLPIWRTKSPC